MKLSIIIPIYNTSNFLRKCIDSCLNQDIPQSDYEIILINDGSTDESHSICEEYTRLYFNIKYIQQENFGQSVARNSGLNIAKGEYIWFIDSDDWIRNNCLDFLMNICCTKKLDILRVGFEKVYEESDTKENTYSYPPELYIKSGKEFLKRKFVFGAPLYIFKRNYLMSNNLFFYPNIYHEDNEFTPRALYFANKIGVTKAIVYFYLTRFGSTTLSVNPKKCFDLLVVCQSLMKFSSNVEKEIKPFINDVISLTLNTALAYSKDIDLAHKHELKRQLLLNKQLFNYMRESKNLKYRVEGLIFSIFPNNVLQIHKLLKSK